VDRGFVDWQLKAHAGFVVAARDAGLAVELPLLADRTLAEVNPVCALAARAGRRGADGLADPLTLLKKFWAQPSGRTSYDGRPARTRTGRRVVFRYAHPPLAGGGQA
jgi:hypothetical protein